MSSQYPPASVTATTLTQGYNLYAWTPNASDPYPIQNGTFSIAFGYPYLTNSGLSATNIAHRIGLMRHAATQTSAGDIAFAGDVVARNGGVGIFCIGLSTASPASPAGWHEMAGFALDDGAHTLKCYTSTATVVSPYDLASGTQRGSTVSGLSTDAVYPFKVTVSANGNTKFEFNGSTVFNGAGGVDLLSTSNGVAVAIGQASSTATGVGISASSVTYP